MTIKLITGVRFGSWTVLGPRTKGNRTRRSTWLCRCDCGIESWVQTSNLTQGLSQSCHPCSKRKPYNVLNMPSAMYQRLSCMARSAIRRCTNAAYPQWKDYGGRGIKVYDEWIEDYRKFVEYLSLLEGCKDESLELDRTNNDGNYEPGNLRFVTRSVSMRNRRSVRQGVR